MNRLQAIEKSLESINESVFQELCDGFLALRNDNYRTFSRTGSQCGKQKTIKGTPDTFLLLPNGKYIFVEYSTNISRGVSKLQEDIKKCIDASKTRISLKEIAEIILCINFNLKTEEIQILNDLLSKTRIVLTVYTLDALALELHLNHRNLVHEYLGLSLDTGQIVSIERFIEEYEKASKGIATPLNNPFLHRDSELRELKELVVQNDFVILSGAPGVGKTKLALETIKDFLKENLTYYAYCLSYKNTTLLEDLFQYINSEKDYILFVDDVNRIDAFNQIIGFYKVQRRGKLKILLTVRDYAFDVVKMLCYEFLPVRFNVIKLTDEQIVEIVKCEPFGILNSQYHKEIVRIADGNPRLAIMTALLAKEKQNIYALSDVSDLFEKYFSTFIKDNKEFVSPLNIKTLGIIAFFYTIPYKNKEIVNQILENFDLDYNLFIDSIDKLDRLELVEIRYDYAKIPEQNLSIYFFYKTFIKDNLLSFEKLLDKYFDGNNNRFKDCVIPANNTFGYQNVIEKLQPILQSYWKTIKTNEERSFKFLGMFWLYLKNETLEFLFHLIEAQPILNVSSYNVEYAPNDFTHNHNPIIELVSIFFFVQDKLKDAIELSFDYVRKQPDYLPELIHEIRESLTFNWEDKLVGFIRQNILFEGLIEGLNRKDLLSSKIFYELSKTFLAFRFRQTEGGRNHTITFYEYPLPFNEDIKNFRKKIWENVDMHFLFSPEESFDLLKSYASNSNVIEEIMGYDVIFLVSIIEKHLTTNSFEHCKYVQEQIRLCKRNKIKHPLFNSLTIKFTNSIYEKFLKIDWNRFQDKKSYDFQNISEYKKLKENEVRNSFILTSISDVKSFYTDFAYLKKIAENDWNYNDVFDIVLDENCTIDFKMGCQLFVEVMEKNNEINYVPRRFFQNHLTTLKNTQYIWNIIQTHEARNKYQWELPFYENLSNSLINENYILSIKNTLSHIESKSLVYWGNLQRYIVFEPDLFKDLLEIIVEKNRNEEGVVLIECDFFNENFGQLANNIKLIKEAYLQQLINQNYFDFDKKGFLEILQYDPNFLIDYVKKIYSQKSSKGYLNDSYDLSFVWKVNNIEPTLKVVFDFVNKKELYLGILRHFCNSFFEHLEIEARERAKFFLLDYCKEFYNDFGKINIIVDIARYSMQEIYDDVILLFVSLTQDLEIFSKIWWRDNGGGVYCGDVIIGDIEAAEWRNILSILEKSSVGIRLIPIKRYINEQIENSLKYAELERKRNFLSEY